MKMGEQPKLSFSEESPSSRKKPDILSAPISMEPLPAPSLNAKELQLEGAKTIQALEEAATQADTVPNYLTSQPVQELHGSSGNWSEDELDENRYAHQAQCLALDQQSSIF